MGPGPHRARSGLELRTSPPPRPDRLVAVTGEPVHRQLSALIAADDGPSLSSSWPSRATLEQWREYLTLRSAYHLKEGDPHTFAIPPLLAAARRRRMVEIQADEYGGGTRCGCTASCSRA